MSIRSTADTDHMRKSIIRTVGLASAVVVPAVVLAATVTSSGDYGVGTQTGDSPAPAIAALLHGHIAAAAAAQPVIGLTSILLRLPFVAAARSLGGGEMLRYRFGVFACALVVGLVGLALARMAVARGRSALLAAAVMALMVLNLMTVGRMLAGHPEELLGGALCLGAILAALDGRPLLAGILLGLALGTKEWALIGVVPVWMACRERRGKMLAVAALVAAPLVLTLPLIDLSAFSRASALIGNLHETYVQSWWRLISSSRTATVHGLEGTVSLTTHFIPFGLSREQVSWLPFAAAIALGYGYRRVQGGRDPADAVGLLALLLLLRCTLDPSYCYYYAVPFVIGLLAWELLTREGLPLVSLLTIAGLRLLTGFTEATPAIVLSLALTVGLAAYLSIHVMRSQRSAPVARPVLGEGPLAVAR